MCDSAITTSPQALDAEADLRAAQAAAAALAELLEFGRAGHEGIPQIPSGRLAVVAAASRDLAGAVDDTLSPTGLAPAARQRVEIAVARVRAGARPETPLYG